MKKLLSLLSSIAISASAASAVVACSDMPTYRNDNETPADVNGNGSSTSNDGPHAAAGIPNAATETPEQRYQKQIKMVQTNMQGVAQKSILEDQFGISANERHMKQLAAGDTIKTSGMSDSSTYGGDDALLGYLGSLKGDDGKALIPEKTIGTIRTVLNLIMPSLKSTGIPNPSDLASMLNTVLPLAGSYIGDLYSTIDGNNGGVSKLEKTLDNKVFTKQIVNVINEVVNHGTVLGQGELDKYANLTVGDSLKSLAIGGAYLLALMTKDSDNAELFSNLTGANEDPFIVHGGKQLGDLTDTANAAIDYIVDTLLGVINKTKTLNINSLLSNILSNETTLDNVSEMVQLLTLYITSFDKYQWTSADYAKGTINNNKVFMKDGNAVDNMTAISDVRGQTIGALAEQGMTKFNPLGLVKDLTYYLGDLDKADGEYRIQALLLMLLGDEDYSNHDFEFTLDSGKMKISDNATPLSSIAVKFIDEFMKGNKDIIKLYNTKLPGAATAALYIPAGFRTFNTVGDVLSWLGFSKDQLDNAIGNNTYALMQSLAWNRGFGMSGTGLSLVDSGKSSNLTIMAVLALIDFNGLSSWKDWSAIKGQGILHYFYNAPNIWQTLHDLGDGLQPTLDKLSIAGINVNLNNIIDGALEPILGQVSDIKDGAKVNTEEFGLSGSIDSFAADHKTITITDGNKESVFSTAPYVTGDENTPNWTGDNEATSQRQNDAPEITSAIAGPTVNGKTDIYVHIVNMYDNSGYSSPGDHTYFLNNMTVNGEAYKGTIVGNTSASGKSKAGNAQNDNVDMTAKVTIDGPITSNMSVGGKAIWYRGKKAGDWSHWSPYYYYQTADVTTSHINTPILKDDLGLIDQSGIKDLYAGDLTNGSAVGSLSAFKKTVNGIDDVYADKSKLKAYYDNSTNVNLIQWVQASADSLSFSREKFMQHSLSWLLQLFAVPQFDQKNGFLGMPIASDLINNKLGQAIVEIGNLIGDTNAQKYGIDISQYRDLINSIIGTGNKDNIVDQFLNALNPDNKNGSLTSRLKDVLGMVSTNLYDRKKLLGALIESFQPSLANSGDANYIQGFGGAKTSDAWDKLTNTDNGIIFNIWNEANTSYVSDEQWSEIYNKDNFIWDPKLTAIVEDKKTGDVTGATWKVTYKFSYTKHFKQKVDTGTKDSDGNEVYTSTDVYQKVNIDQGYTIKLDGTTYTITKD